MFKLGALVLTTMSTYSEKLKHPKWQKKRLEILQRDYFKCQLCKDDKTELQIHHLKYIGEPWDAPNECLETLCKTCHYYKTKHNAISAYDFPNGKIYDCNDILIVYSTTINEPLICFFKDSAAIKLLYKLSTHG